MTQGDIIKPEVSKLLDDLDVSATPLIESDSRESKSDQSINDATSSVQSELQFLRGEIADLRVRVSELTALLQQVLRPSVLVDGGRERGDISPESGAERVAPPSPSELVGLSGYITVRQASEMLGLSRTWIKDLLVKRPPVFGGARKLDGIWYIPHEEVKHFRPPGRGHPIAG